MTKLWRSGIILSGAGLVSGLGNYAFQSLIGRQLEKVEYGYVNTTLGFIGFLSLPLLIASTSMTHYVAHFNASGDQARLQGLLAGCRVFLFRLTVAGSILAVVLVKPLSAFFNFPRASLMFVALSCVLAGLWGAWANALCQGLAWFKRLAVIGLIAMALRLSFGWVALGQYLTAEVGVMASGVALLANLILLWWREELAGRGESVSPWNKELAGYLAAGTACMGASYLFTQGDVLVAQRNFAGEDLGFYTAAALLARALPITVAPMLTVLFTSRSGHRSGSAQREQLKLLGLYAVGLAAGAASLLIWKDFWVLLIFGKKTPAAASMIGNLSVTMVFVGLLQAIGMWALASRWFRVALLYGACGLAYWLVLLVWGQSPRELILLMPVGAGMAFLLVFVSWLLALRASHPHSG